MLKLGNNDWVQRMQHGTEYEASTRETKLKLRHCVYCDRAKVRRTARDLDDSAHFAIPQHICMCLRRA